MRFPNVRSKIPKADWRRSGARFPYSKRTRCLALCFFSPPGIAESGFALAIGPTGFSLLGSTVFVLAAFDPRNSIYRPFELWRARSQNAPSFCVLRHLERPNPVSPFPLASWESRNRIDGFRALRFDPRNSIYRPFSFSSLRGALASCLKAVDSPPRFDPRNSIYRPF